MAVNPLKKPAKRSLTIRLDLEQHILKAGLRALIEGDPRLCYLDGELERNADVTVIDLSDQSAEEKIYCQDFASETKFVVLAELMNSIVLEQIVKSDVRAIVAKTTDGQGFLRAIRIVGKGGRWLDSSLMDESGTKAPSLLEQLACWERLTNREREVAALMLRGAQTNAIAIALDISDHTVRGHRRNIFEKLHIHSRLELARYWTSQLGSGS